MQNKYLQVWEEYCVLEKEFKEVVSYISLEHLNVWSSKIANLLINLGSVIDSFFKLSLEDKEFSNIKKIIVLRKKDWHNMVDYRDIFEDNYNLSTKKIYIRYLDEFRKPFEKWSQADKSLEWWKDYQSVKHDRFKNKKKATLGSLLNGMAGLFLLNVIHLPSRLVLNRLDMIKCTSKLEEDYMEKCIDKNEPIGNKKTQSEKFYVKTELFGYVYKSTNPDSIDDDVYKKLLALFKEPRIQ